MMKQNGTSYIEESLKFIESEEMREYLRERFGQGDFRLPGYTCANIVSYAPAPIEQKIPVLDLIAAQTEPDPEHGYGDPGKLARAHRIALDERYNNAPPGTMFWLRDWCYHEKGFDFGDAFFTGFDAAVRYIKELPKADYYDGCDEWLSYSIDKCVPGENGAIIECCQWVLSASGEIWYFDYEPGREPKGWDDIMDYGGMSLNLPVPFGPGDIILADCRPFSKERRVLILEVGDNSDCCCLQCLYILSNDKIDSSGFKHNTFHGPNENSHISGLYRARRWHDELPEEERFFSELSAAIKANPELGVTIGDWVHSHIVFDKDADDDCPGALVEEMLNAFGLPNIDDMTDSILEDKEVREVLQTPSVLSAIENIDIGDNSMTLEQAKEYFFSRLDADVKELLAQSGECLLED